MPADGDANLEKNLEVCVVADDSVKRASGAETFIAFRAKLNQMVRAGVFAESIGPLVYAIQERQEREIRFRVQEQRMALLPAVIEIFSRSDLLSLDDFKFFVSSLRTPGYWHLLCGLTFASDGRYAKDCTWKSFSLDKVGDKLFLALFFRDCERHLDVECEHLWKDKVSSTFLGGRLFPLLASVLPTEEARKTYLALESVLEVEKRQDSRYYTERDIVERAPLNLPVELDHITLGLTINPGDEAVSALNWIEKYREFEPIALDADGTSPARIMEKVVVYGNALLNEPSSGQVPMIRDLLHDRLHACTEDLIALLGKKSSLAIQCFGTPTKKALATLIPDEMLNFIKKVRAYPLNDEIEKRLLAQALAALLNCRSSHMSSRAVNKVVDEVKDDIDWEYCVGKLNAKGRAQLIQEFSETEYYKHLLKKNDLGMVFSQDLGL